jgi:hypothetical protein
LGEGGADEVGWPSGMVRGPRIQTLRRPFCRRIVVIVAVETPRKAAMTDRWSMRGFSEAVVPMRQASVSLTRSNVKRMSERSERSLLEGLALRRVRMDRSSEVLQPRAHFQRQAEGGRKF